MQAEWTNGMRDVIYVVKEKRKNEVLRGETDHVVVARYRSRYKAERYCKDNNGRWSDRLCNEIADLTGIKRGKGRYRFQEIKRELKEKKFFISEERLDD